MKEETFMMYQREKYQVPKQYVFDVRFLFRVLDQLDQHHQGTCSMQMPYLRGMGSEALETGPAICFHVYYVSHNVKFTPFYRWGH